MKRLTIIVGAGGTGSYLLPNLLAFYNGLAGNVENKIILMDGDVVEDKNLLRQGFLQDSLNQNKSDALVDTYKYAYNDIELESKPMFLNNADALLTMVKDNADDLDDVVLISCVDNNYARLRLVVGQQLIKQFYPQLEVTFVDSGNEEWHGQTIITTMDDLAESILTFENGSMTVKEDKYDNRHNAYDNIFVRMNDWTNHLTKGDHEISCDIVTVSHPQNVSTNMTASSLIINSLGRLVRGLEPKNISFNANKNKINLYDITPKEEYIRAMTEISDFINSDAENSVISKVFQTMNGGKTVKHATSESEANTELILETLRQEPVLVNSESAIPETEETDSTRYVVVVEETEIEESTDFTALVSEQNNPLSDDLPQEISSTESEKDFSFLLGREDSEVSVDPVLEVEVENIVAEIDEITVDSVDFSGILNDEQLVETPETLENSVNTLAIEINSEELDELLDSPNLDFSDTLSI